MLEEQALASTGRAAEACKPRATLVITVVLLVGAMYAFSGAGVIGLWSSGIGLVLGLLHAFGSIHVWTAG